ncbi:porin [Burkholderia multivorans]|uniref:porin n=1 Tax=Burkholderia multivorans TaxID=87883 RepID=UPI000CFEFA70|nr:porin [Burkholderia multivorans]AYZ00067.1 porin [Burkholderia multivorans]MBU9117631.1 porin [Burkholderia multivorans]PRF50518.1 porin [Burkholderia multivorans]PRG48207.1 porin [Burkholderia multivorans]HDV6320659.1 porin [Burkholderia multivorans]
MKKWHFCAVVAIGAGVGATAHAQSSITLYGLLDSGILFANHSKVGPGKSGDQWSLGTGNRQNSRWGLIGKEDLGAGLTAIFNLESGMAMNNGALQQGGRLFGRIAYVGLQSDVYGSLMLGRQQVPMYKFGLALDPLAYSSFGFSAQDSQFVGRADNAIAYQGKRGPFEVNALYSFGYESVTATTPVAGAYRVGKEVDVAARYVDGPANVTFAFEKRQGTAIASADLDERRYLIGGSYQVRKATLYAGYELLLNKVPASMALSPSKNMFYGGVRYQATAFLDLAAAGYYHQFRAIGDHALSLGLNADYWLSKRTSVYTNVQYVINGDKAALSATGLGGPTAQTTVQTGANQLAFAIGILHKF